MGVTFEDFDTADREALGSYVLGEEATFWRTWSPADGEKLTGRGRAYRPFADVRRHEKATPKRDAYRQLCEARPDLGLPKASSAAAVDAALDTWEIAHPKALEDSPVNATHLFGFTGGARLNGRFDFVLVPAVSDQSVRSVARSSAVGADRTASDDFAGINALQIGRGRAQVGVAELAFG